MRDQPPTSATDGVRCGPVHRWASFTDASSKSQRSPCCLPSTVCGIPGSVSSVESSARRIVSVVTGALAGSTLERALTAIADAGVGAAELTIGPSGHVEIDAEGVGPDLALDDAVALIRSHGMTLCGLAATIAWPIGHPGLRRVVAEAARIGARFVRAFPPRYVAAVALPTQLNSAALELRALEKISGWRTRLLIEPSGLTLAPSAELALRMIEQSGASTVGVVYDPANLTDEGSLQPDYAIALLDGRIGHVHVKNRSPECVDGRWTSRYAPLDAGLVDWPHTIGALDRSGYAGTFSLDHLSGPANAATLAGDLAALDRVFRSVQRRRN